MRKDNLMKYLPLVLVLITMVLGISYFHESGVMTQVRDEVESGSSAPIR